MIDNLLVFVDRNNTDTPNSVLFLLQLRRDIPDLHGPPLYVIPTQYTLPLFLWSSFELHIATARKPLIHQNQPVAQYLHKKAMYIVVNASRLTAQHSIVKITNWLSSYWQILYPSWQRECFWRFSVSAHKFASALLRPRF